MVSVVGLRAVRGGREVLRIDALHAGEGERLGVLGPNGAGKTTLLRVLAGLDRPAAGEVRVDGIAVTAGGTALRRRVGYVTQRPQLLSLSVRRNVELPLRYRGVGRRDRAAAAAAALERMGIAHLADRPAASLSGGEAQRVSLADLETALAGRAATVVHVSHRPEELLGFAGRVAVLARGEVRQLAAPGELARRPADALVAALVGYENVVPVTARDGELHLAGRPTGLQGGEGHLAVWATGVRVHRPGEAPLPAAVTSAAPGPGRWDVVCDAGVPLRAHLPLEAEPPAPGEPVSLELVPALTALLGPQRTRRPISAAS